MISFSLDLFSRIRLLSSMNSVLSPSWKEFFNLTMNESSVNLTWEVLPLWPWSIRGHHEPSQFVWSTRCNHFMWCADGLGHWIHYRTIWERHPSIQFWAWWIGVMNNFQSKHCSLVMLVISEYQVIYWWFNHYHSSLLHHWKHQHNISWHMINSDSYTLKIITSMQIVHMVCLGNIFATTSLALHFSRDQMTYCNPLAIWLLSIA